MMTTGALLLAGWSCCCIALFAIILVDQGKRRCRKVYDRAQGVILFGKTRARGKQYSLDVPKHFFKHFYVLAFFWNLFLLYHASAGNARVVAAYQLHLSRRLYESMFVHIFSVGSRMNVLHYGFGILFYIMAPLTIAFDEGHGHDHTAPFTFFCGSVVLAGAFVVQFRSHTILASLRNNKDRETYAIPRGGLFEYVSSPHYLAEIIIYISLGVMSSPMIRTLRHAAIWALMLCTIIVNLSVSAIKSHAWYRRTFKNYPKSRRALIPSLTG